MKFASPSSSIAAAVVTSFVVIGGNNVIQIAPVDAALCEGKEEVLTHLDFYDATLSENTLHWPNQTGRLRYDGVGMLKGQSIDLVVTQTKGSQPYSTDKPTRNGYNYGDDPDNLDYTWSKFGNINVMTYDPREHSEEDVALMNGEGTFDFCFYYAGTEDLATVDSFDWSVYDMDFRNNGGLNEKFTIDTAQAKYYTVRGESEVKMWCENEGPNTAIKNGKFKYLADEGVEGKEENRTNIQAYKAVTCDPGVKTIFHSTTKGGLDDNPTNPERLTKQQKARSIEFRFENTSCWTFKYEHYCPCGNYCDEPGGGPSNLCTGKKWCPKSTSDRNNYDPNFPNACKKYTGGNFLFAGTSDETLTEEGECVTPPPSQAPEPTDPPTDPPTPPPTPGPTPPPTPPPTTAPTSPPTTAPTSPPTPEPTLPPFEETTTPPQRPGECVDNGVIVKHLHGVTAYPTSPVNPVSIVGFVEDGDHSTVTVSLNQFWDENSIGHVFASYKTSLYDQVCYEETNVAGGSTVFDDPITIQCHIMTPYANLEICIADDLAKQTLSEGDDAEIPECCHPEIPPDYGKVCYMLQITCSLECVDVVEADRLRHRKMLRAGN